MKTAKGDDPHTSGVAGFSATTVARATDESESA